MNLRKVLGIVGRVQIDLRAAGFVGMQNAEWRRVDVDGDEVLFTYIRVAKLVNVRNVGTGNRTGRVIAR